MYVYLSNVWGLIMIFNQIYLNSSKDVRGKRCMRHVLVAASAIGILGLSACSEPTQQEVTSPSVATSSSETATLEKAQEAYNNQNFGIAQDLLRPLANNGDVSAQFLLGDMLFKGQGSAINLEESVKWFQKASDNGSPLAQFQLAMMYSDAVGVPNDEGKAVKYMKMSSENGNARAQYMLGLHEIRNDNKDLGIDLLVKSADGGYDAAQHILGEFYARGDSVPKDLVKAAALLTKSAEQNNKNAQATLGFLYSHGEGVEKNLKMAARLFYGSAKQGHAESMARLTKFAETGLSEAQYYLSLLYRDGDNVDKDFVSAREWMAKAAEQNFAPAQFQLGEALGAGQGGEQDYLKAHMWMNLAAAGGNEDALARRDVFAKLMTKEQIAEAQTMARKWTQKYKAMSDL